MIKGEKIKELYIQETKLNSLRIKMSACFIAVELWFAVISFLILYIATNLGFSLDRLKNPLTGMIVVSILAMIMSAAACFLLIRMVFRPLEKISAASKKVTEGDFSVQIKYDGGLEDVGTAIENFNRMVQELNSVEVMRNDFVADVSHEFKTPLAAITGYVTFLQDPELPEEERNEYIRKIFFNVDKLNDLTENILRLSRLEHQQFLDDPVAFRLDEQIREAIVLLEPKWGKKHIAFDLQLPEIVYTGQKGLLFQVWMNIIGNAIKYSDDYGNIEVALKEKTDCCEIIVSDDGIGMSEETQAHIFDKFYQADTSRKAQGNGLGLALCHEIIDKCNGKIIVESTLGVGSVFIVKLPKEVSRESL